MGNPLHLIDIHKLDPDAGFALESGQILYFPTSTFPLKNDEQAFLSDSILHPKHKNISYNYSNNHLAGLDPHQSLMLKDPLITFMHRFAEYAKTWVDTVLPWYTPHLIWGRTSYRPAEIKGRVTSARKDDKRLHVDAFPATPVNGLRILRVFCNINPHHIPRVWEVGEPFSEVLFKFKPHLTSYQVFRARFLKWIKATKTLRSPYDHYMLQLHDQMKLSKDYQQTVPKQRIEFPSGSTWIVFTDQVSHAALSGQFLLEQTFYLPVEALQYPALSPLKQLEQIYGEM